MDPVEIKNSELIQETFRFWYSEQQHIRSPFPEYIRDELKKTSIEIFYNWINGIKDKTKKKIDMEVIRSKLEEIIFETAFKLVKTEDERMTIYFPFLPRIGDPVLWNKDNNGGSSERNRVVERVIERKGDQIFMKVRLESQTSGKSWETSFELPA